MTKLNRTPEPEPRIVTAEPYGPLWVVKGKDLVRALKGLRRVKDAVRIGTVIVGSKSLAELASICRHDILQIYVGDDFLRIKNGRHESTIKHGAWDRGNGEAGYNASLVFTT